ncbi:b1728 [Wigglesworthia glossinidia endosymbiont of Glossina brevipalpis]|uniref:B1728 protein n=1 Tax=Wigglesworthia glossinidia brevipalpis TaxID=36870 RepID=Q8D1W8_WIGBR|nr:b1728 [Wigglesworthia glossinidia endosymbiont of Glossina brevipalpis]
MTSKGHLIFGLSVAIFLKKIEIFNALYLGKWGHIITGSICSCLLPDMDHPGSFLGKKLNWISIPISKTFGHRGFTHSLLSLFLLYVIIFSNIFNTNYVFPLDFSYSLLVGYFSHILADFFTPFGVPLFWPFKFKICLPILPSNNIKRERTFCYLVFAFSVLYPFDDLIFVADLIDIQFIKINLKKVYIFVKDLYINIF